MNVSQNRECVKPKKSPSATAVLYCTRASVRVRTVVHSSLLPLPETALKRAREFLLATAVQARPHFAYHTFSVSVITHTTPNVIAIIVHLTERKQPRCQPQNARHYDTSPILTAIRSAAGRRSVPHVHVGNSLMAGHGSDGRGDSPRGLHTHVR